MQQFIYIMISTILKFQPPDPKNVEMGYIECGHGLKGRKIWIDVDSDDKMIYDHHQTLSFFGVTQKLMLRLQRR